jgi:hypothetical protein
LIGEESAHFGGGLGGGVADEGLDFGGGIIGEDQDRRFEVLVEIGRFGETGERLAFAGGGRKDDNLPIPAFDLGPKKRGDGLSGEGLGEENETVGQVELDVFAGKREIANAPALGGVEANRLQCRGHRGGGH